MPQFTRSVMAVVAGCLAAYFHIGAIQALSRIIYPPPEGLDPAKPETMAAYMKVIPTGAMLMILLAWLVGTFAGSWLTARLAPEPKRNHGLIIGALFTIAAMASMVAIPHLAWFWVASLAAFLPVSYLGAALASPSRRPIPQPSGPRGPSS
jgi:hypothetical protein